MRGCVLSFAPTHLQERVECLCAIVRLYVLLCSVCGSLPGTLWSRFVESCRDLMFSRLVNVLIFHLSN